ncbi:hypothetical protein [Aquabacterium sp.]|uniref:hypothetical protein n=1 Tax=Aquabacterium sp. TaxID=1872578 RepID=UPI002489324B|nr:hypothetical protein [Aquabacterium sp.]MDI1257671.1 hypothetical protein [Aquabacterium sp.]
MNKHFRSIKLQAVVLITGALLSTSAFSMGRHDAPCDGFMDCIYTAYWYAFLR